MTGEITLRGRVLPIGGLKEKILAAHRSGITTVIMPKENAKDLRDIPKRVLKSLKVVPVEHMDEVLRAALVLPKPGGVPDRAVGARRLAPAGRAARARPESARRAVADAGRERGAAAVGARGDPRVAALRRAGVSGASGSSPDTNALPFPGRCLASASTSRYPHCARQRGCAAIS